MSGCVADLHKVNFPETSLRIAVALFFYKPESMCTWVSVKMFPCEPHCCNPPAHGIGSFKFNRNVDLVRWRKRTQCQSTRDGPVATGVTKIPALHDFSDTRRGYFLPPGACESAAFTEYLICPHTHGVLGRQDWPGPLRDPRSPAGPQRAPLRGTGERPGGHGSCGAARPRLRSGARAA
jgi:hypothetical protein